MEIDLERLDSLAIDISGFPGAILELKYKGETYIEKIKFSTHSQAYDAMSQINVEWQKILGERYKNE